MMELSDLPRCGGAAVELLHSAPSPAELTRLRAVLDERGVLLIRGCEDVVAFAALCRGIGKLHDDVNGPGRGRPELCAAGIEVHYISNLDLASDTVVPGPTSMLSDANSDFHSDYSWSPDPKPRFTALFGLEVSAGGGAKTQIASTLQRQVGAPQARWCTLECPGGREFRWH
jgi:hypothetical protein